MFTVTDSEAVNFKSPIVFTMMFGVNLGKRTTICILIIVDDNISMNNSAALYTCHCRFSSRIIPTVNWIVLYLENKDFPSESLFMLNILENVLLPIWPQFIVNVIWS